MPYAANADLPPAVREKYSDRCMTVFRHTFNATEGDEALRFKFAHTAAMNCMEAAKNERSPLVDMTVKFAEGSDSIIEGYGVPFGVDLDGESFTAKTDLCLDWWPNGGRPILFDHGFDSAVKFSAIGHELSSEMTDEGLWVKAQLDKASKYYERVKKLVEKGIVGWSSGAPDHKVKMGKGGVYERWPAVEFSLTATPSKPNRVAYAMKSAEVDKALADVDIPEPLSEADIEQAPSPGSGSESFDEQVQRIVADSSALVERAEKRWEIRGAKVGREFSNSNIEALRQADKALGESRSVIRALLERAERPSEAEAEATKASLELQLALTG